MSEARPPVIGSLFPQGLAWENPPPALRDFLSPLNLDVRSVACPTGAGKFRHILAQDNLGSQLFGTIIAEAACESYQSADALARLAASLHVTTPLLVGPPITLDHETVLLLRPYVLGKHGPDKDIDFANLGTAVALLHDALSPALIPLPALTLASEKSALRLKRVAVMELPYELWTAVAPLDALQRLTGNWEQLSDYALNEPVQCHGDLHAANVLFKPDGEVVFLDFEESPHSCLNPMIDLARVFERFLLVLLDQQGEDWAYRQAMRFFQAYAVKRPAVKFQAIKEALSFYRALSARICISAGDPSLAIWRDELAKMLFLDQMATRHSRFIEALQQELNWLTAELPHSG